VTTEQWTAALTGGGDSKLKTVEESTGPESAAGKATSAGNGQQHGNRARAALEQLHWLREYL